MSDMEPGEMSDEELFEAYQRAKSQGTQFNLDEIRLEICERWEKEVDSDNERRMTDSNRQFAYGENTVSGVGCPVTKSSIDVAPEDTDAVQEYDGQLTKLQVRSGVTDETTARTAWLNAINELEARRKSLRESDMTDQAKACKQSLRTAQKVARDLGWIENNNE